MFIAISNKNNISNKLISYREFLYYIFKNKQISCIFYKSTLHKIHSKNKNSNLWQTF